MPRVRAHARADEAEIRIIAELGVWRGFGAPEPWRQRLNVSAGGQGDEWERIRSEVLREVRRKTKGKGGCVCGKYSSRRFCPECCHKQAYACDHDGCGKTFAHVGPFEVHKRSHTGEKPFACDYVGCSARCNTSYGLTEHKRTHAGARALPPDPQ